MTAAANTATHAPVGGSMMMTVATIASADRDAAITLARNSRK